jgi:hypothetical protein
MWNSRLPRRSSANLALWHRGKHLHITLDQLAQQIVRGLNLLVLKQPV